MNGPDDNNRYESKEEALKYKTRMLWRGRRIAIIREDRKVRLTFPRLSIQRALIAINLALICGLAIVFMIDVNRMLAIGIVVISALIITVLAYLGHIRKSNQPPFLLVDEESNMVSLPRQELHFQREHVLRLEQQFGWKEGYLYSEQPESWCPASPNLTGHTMVRMALITMTTSELQAPIPSDMPSENEEKTATNQWSIVRLDPRNDETGGEPWAHLGEIGRALEKETGIPYIEPQEIDVSGAIEDLKKADQEARTNTLST